MIVYDVSNRATPMLSRNLTLNGSYLNSRMIDNYVHLIVSKYLLNLLLLGAISNFRDLAVLAVSVFIVFAFFFEAYSQFRELRYSS